MIIFAVIAFMVICALYALSNMVNEDIDEIDVWTW